MIIVSMLMILVFILVYNIAIYITYEEYKLSKSKINLILLICLVAGEVGIMLHTIGIVMN